LQISQQQADDNAGVQALPAKQTKQKDGKAKVDSNGGKPKYFLMMLKPVGDHRETLRLG
jgi:hypothetical protein